jgi:uncharacterized membrane protein
VSDSQQILMPIQRLTRLSDIVFAMAMTILALIFAPMPSEQISPETATQLLLNQLPSLEVYAVTFITMAFYWFTHVNQFKHYQQTNTIHTCLSLCSLFFVVLLPYASDLSESYEGVFALQVFYSLSAAGIGIFSTGAWIYGTQNRRLVAPELSDETIRQIRQESYIEPILYLLAIGAAWLAPWGWFLTLLIGFPAALFIQSRMFRHATDSTDAVLVAKDKGYEARS